MRDATNDIGFRDDNEHDMVVGGKLRFGTALLGADPSGITFRNSAQRVLWLLGQCHALDRQETEVLRQMRQSEYDRCVRAGRDEFGVRSP